MDGNEISGILFQALRGVTRLGQEGEATKKALLRTIEAAAEIGRPSKKTVMKAEAKGEPGEEAAPQAETLHHWYDMLANRLVTLKRLIRERRYTAEEMEEMGKTIEACVGYLKTTGAKLAFINQPECPDRRADVVGARQRVRTGVRLLEEVRAMLLAQIQERMRQEPAIRAAPRRKPCRMASQGCTESHALGACENF